MHPISISRGFFHQPMLRNHSIPITDPCRCENVNEWRKQDAWNYLCIFPHSHNPPTKRAFTCVHSRIQSRIIENISWSTLACSPIVRKIRPQIVSRLWREMSATFVINLLQSRRREKVLLLQYCFLLSVLTMQSISIAHLGFLSKYIHNKQNRLLYGLIISITGPQ